MLGETHQSVACRTPPTGDLALNLCMCPDQESNQQHFNLQNNAQPTEPCQSGPYLLFSHRIYHSGRHVGCQEVG